MERRTAKDAKNAKMRRGKGKSRSGDADAERNAIPSESDESRNLSVAGGLRCSALQHDARGGVLSRNVAADEVGSGGQG